MALTPYSTVEPMFGTLPTWLTVDDAQRLMAYQRYEEMYWNDPDGYKIVLRGSESKPIYVPSAMSIVEATNRFLGKNWTFVCDPRLGTPEQRELLSAWLTPLFRRERVWGKFLTQKRYGLIRGDAVWGLFADPAKPPGKRLRVVEVDPGAYFPIMAEDDDTRVVGQHMVEQTLAKDGTTTIIKKQTWRKTETGGITYELSWWEQGAWDDRNLEPKDLKKATTPPSPAIPPTLLPPQITALPLYHIKNDPTPSAPFGSSVLRGMESVLAGITQAISDSDISLALGGVGLYVTTSGPPVDDAGEETDWQIGPGYVAEIDPEADFKRVNGVTSVQPTLDHTNFLLDAMMEARGVPDVARGHVEAALAESGIALALKMSPILSANAEREGEMLGVYDQMLHDLCTMWLPAYEGVSFGEGAEGAVAVSVVDDPLPQNRKAVLEEIVALTTNGFISVEYGRQLLSERLGYEFPDQMGETVVEEMKTLAAARNVDPFVARVEQEMQL